MCNVFNSKISGQILVVDQNVWIVKFSADGKFDSKVELDIKPRRYLKTPRIRYARNCGQTPELLYLSDMNNFMVHLAMPDGVILNSFGNGQGFRPDQFQQPAGVAIDSQGNFIVAGKSWRDYRGFYNNRTMVALGITVGAYKV